MSDADLTFLWFGGAGALGAFANQLVYWSNVFRRRGKPRLVMFIFSIFFVLVGGGVGVIVGAEHPDYLLAFGLGAVWPEFVKAMRAAAETLVKVRTRYLMEAGG